MLASSRGFTLVELMVAIAITAIILTLGVPSFRTMLQNNRSLALSNPFISALNFAKTEAIRRATFISFCAAANSSLNACGSASAWPNGWIVFIDVNNNGVIDSPATEILQVYDASSYQGAITASNGRVTFSNIGSVSVGNGTYTLKANGCTGNNARIITVTTGGMIRSAVTGC